MKINNLDALPKVRMSMEGVKDTYKQLPISSKDGTPSFSFRVFTIDPGGHTPFHTHPFEHLNYVIEGQGVLVGANGEERTVKKGDFALVLPGEQHQYRNKSDAPFIMICAVPKDYE